MAPWNGPKKWNWRCKSDWLVEEIGSLYVVENSSSLSLRLKTVNARCSTTAEGQFITDLWSTDKNAVLAMMTEMWRWLNRFINAGGNTMRTWVISGICDFVCAWYVRTLRWKWLELSTPNVVVHTDSTCFDPEVKRAKVKVTGSWSVCRRGYARRYDCLGLRRCDYRALHTHTHTHTHTLMSHGEI